jgi:cytochrome c-type biogenesis protein CcmH
MTAFLIGAALLVALALALLLWPLLRSGRAGSSRDQAIVSIYRDQFRELAADHAAGTIGAEQFEGGRRELERRLLQEVSQSAVAPAAGRRPVASVAAIAVFLVVLPVGLYLALGKPAAINPVPPQSEAAAQADQNAAGHPITPKQVQGMIDQLAKRLEENPRDGEGWAMLARSYSFVRQFPQAVKAYAKAVELQPTDAHLYADYADALAMTNERRLAGEPMKLIQRSLSIDPNEVKALALAGSEAFDRHDYTGAIGYWNRAIKAGPKEPQFVEQLRGGIEEARKLGGTGALAPEAMAPPAAAAASAPAAAGAAAAPAGKSYVKGRVSLATALAGKVSPGDKLFIFARAAQQGARVPLALMVRQVKDLPLDFALDETMAMMADMNLSKFQTVIVGARVSKGGDAIASSGDLQGFSGPVKVGSTGVQVQIDQVVP